MTGIGDQHLRAPDLRSLEPDSLVRAALRAEGEPADGPLRFTDGLERLAGAVDTEARLTDPGRVRVRSALVSALRTQLQVGRMTPAGAAPPDVPARPVFLTGLLRTGTTFLHNLLAQHPALRVPRLWELMAPADPRTPEALIRRCERYVAEYDAAAPGFRAIHPLDARMPEECHRLTANSFRDPIYGLRYRVPGYLAWLDTTSMVPAYDYHRVQLGCILRRAPGRPVVLKGPSHLWYLDELYAAYPDATVIRLHRDPAIAVPSVCSLTAVVRSARSGDVDAVEIGRYWTGRARVALAGLRRGAGPGREAPLDLRYADLVADPAGTVARVCDHIGVPLTDGAQARVDTFLAAERNRSDRRAHRYRPADFGLDPARLREQFADYITEFDLEEDRCDDDAGR